MSLRRSLLALGALGSAASLPGCVAAVIPLAAGSLMASSGNTGGGTKPQATAPAADAAPLAKIDAPVSSDPVPSLTTTAVAPGPLPGSVAGLAGETGTGDLIPLQGGTFDGLTVLRGQAPPPSPGSDRVVESFLAHALEQAQRNPGLTPRQSALLAEPGALRPERMDCGSRPPAVIIDLDPGKESFDPLVPVAGNPRLAAALAELRERGVTVFWTSHLGEGFAESLRSVLAVTGLDPAGQDRLLLLRSLDQRKHTRRTEIAQTHCVVAMLGDERADFDELFHYLRQPDTALRLDAMLGSGWFLADPLPRPPMPGEFETGGEPQP